MKARYRKGRLWEPLAVLAASGVLFLVAAQHPRSLAAWLILWAASAAVLTVFGCFAWRGRFDRRVMLELTDQGIWYRGWRIGPPLPWSEIKAARFQMAPRGEPWICLDLHDEARVLQDPLYAPAANRSRTARWVNATTFSLRTTSLDVPNQQAMALIQHRLKPQALAVDRRSNNTT